MKVKLLLLVCCFFTAGPVIAQQGKFNINIQNSTLKETFKVIQNESGYRFFYSDDLVDLDKKMNLEGSNFTIDEIIGALESKTNLSFRKMEDKLIVVVPANEEQHPGIVSGRVTSADEQEGLPGVNVIIKGTSKGVITDASGNYSIEIPNENVVLQYSFIGFNTQEFSVNGQRTINVVLTEDIQSIDEIVVTALAIERDKNSLGYSITQVSADEINQAKENNPINSLAGKVAGLQITKAPTGVDGSSRVILRGVASLLGNNRPLFVIDGIPMDAGYGGGGRWGGVDSGDALSDLNPEDIESMSVLKGAGAAAAYGSRGANGVILVTTKKGKIRKGIGISVSSGYTVETPMITPEFQYAYAQGAFTQYPAMNGSRLDHPWIWSYGPKIEGQQVKDWMGNETTLVQQGNPYDEFFRTGSTFTNSVAFNGGNKTTSFRASITNQVSKGIMPNNGLDRQTVNFRGSSKMGEKISFDGKITYIRSNVENRPHLSEDGANIVQALNILPRSISLESLQNNTVDEYGNEKKWTVDNTFSNPYWILENMKNSYEKNRLQAMFSMNWNLATNLDFMVRSGFDYSNSNSKSHEAAGRPDLNTGRGRISQNIGNGIEWNSDVLLTYSNNIDNVGFHLSAGGNYRYNKGNSISQWGNVERVPEFYNISNYKNFGTSEWYSQKAVYSAYVLGSISFEKFLYLDITARNDWSSTLPLENNSYFYHSENLSFLFTEAFGIKNNILNMGKLRASYAKVGNDTGAYQIDQYYNISQTQTEFPLATISGQLPHFDLKPEETYSWEVGTNLSLFNNRFMIDATYYYSISDNQIMNVDLTPSTGYENKKMNAGKIENSGIELKLDGNLVSAKNGFNWDVILTWSKNNSIVRELYGNMKFLLLAEEFHMTMEAHVDQPYGQIYIIDYKRDSFGNKLIDKNGYAQAGERKAMGDINPDWIGGITNRLTYKNFSLGFLIDVQKGGDIYSWGKSYRALFGTSTETLEGREEWAAGTGGFVESGIKETNGKPNDVAIGPTNRWYNLYNKQIGTEWLLDASNIRMREVVLGYSVPAKLLKNAPVSDVNFSLVGRNLFFLYNAMGDIDPESGYSSGSTGNGIEHLSLPSTSSYGVNLKINF
ncbi:TonB-linked outer membrane protein, SusC/RagA family [Mariniphaga anaerophila]|uniref:TonB-linked outer membrane protein, SusC/RagA family n=1 Tax=Mariniphaga anaerophila TaxID=1484053 RepID=A0A1M4XKC0_9BACT|nr:SusC/RagA family TonB-linked outer membrane protein [Mariniphaga anaerophila]SHE94004.1 TonB-linked outer membrane protein, SusC/RagA family [Mariniphaga anaerophila]